MHWKRGSFEGQPGGWSWREISLLSTPLCDEYISKMAKIPSASAMAPRRVLRSGMTLRTASALKSCTLAPSAYSDTVPLRDAGRASLPCPTCWACARTASRAATSAWSFSRSSAFSLIRCMCMILSYMEACIPQVHIQEKWTGNKNEHRELDGVVGC